MKKIKILSIGVLIIIIVAFVSFCCLTKESEYHSDDSGMWGVGIFHYANVSNPDIWYGYVFCKEKVPPAYISISYSISDQTYQMTSYANDTIKLPIWEHIQTGGGYTAIYPLIDLAPTYPQIKGIKITPPLGTPVLIPDFE